MNHFIRKNHRLLFYGCWLLLTVMQAGMTHLIDDEAYYWVYSRFPDWGYFDHPPMIAVLIKAGYALFPNALGVRLFPLVLNFFSLLLIENLLDRKNPLLFYCIALNMAVLQLTGFIAVPDIPLIFFTALFFTFFRRFSRQPGTLNSIFLGITVALLLYSKYHAVLIILLVLFSDRKLFMRPQTYLAGILAFLLFMPHLWWQYQHNWVSVRYHLFENNINPFRLKFTADYLLGQLLIAGPVAGVILIPCAFLYRPKDATEKAMRYTLAGIYIFFFLSSFRGRVEANWTAPALVPLFVLAHRYLDNHPKPARYLWYILPLSLALVLVARVCMIADIVPMRVVKKNYHAWEKWPDELKEITHGLPVVFENSYQRASQYWFNTGVKGYSHNYYKSRKNNYNLWPIEDSLLGKPVYYLDIRQLNRFSDSLKTNTGWVGYRYVPSFASFAGIDIEPSRTDFNLRSGDSLRMTCRFHIPEHYLRFIRKSQPLADTVRIGVFADTGWVKDVFTGLRLSGMAEKPEQTITVYPGLPPGEYTLRFAINCGFLDPTHNSDKLKLDVR